MNVTLICPDCKQFPPDLIERFSEGDIICGQCGLVLSDRIVDTRSEWRTFQNDDKNTDDPSRVGDASNSLYDTEDLTTMISYAPNSNSGSSKNSLNKINRKALSTKRIMHYRQLIRRFPNYVMVINYLNQPAMQPNIYIKQ